MSTILRTASTLSNPSGSSDNGTSLVSLIALFYAKGDIPTANYLIESLLKDN